MNRLILPIVKVKSQTHVSAGRKFLMLPLRGLHGKHSAQHGIWVPTEHLFWDQGKPLSSCPVSGTSGCNLTSSHPSGIKSANPNFSSLSELLGFHFLSFLSLPTSCSLQLFVCVWFLVTPKPYIAHVEGINRYVNKDAYKYIYICICDSLTIVKFDSIFC
jgi:hypothetical protein